MQETEATTATVQQLREAHLWVTAPRVAVLEALGAHPHISAKTITQLVRGRIGKVSTQTVYDVLAAYVEAGLVQSIELAGSAARYETRSGDNHHHLVCRICERVTDVDCVVGERPCLTPNDDAGYLVDTAELVFWGLCPQCQKDKQV